MGQGEQGLGQGEQGTGKGEQWGWTRSWELCQELETAPGAYVMRVFMAKYGKTLNYVLGYPTPVGAKQTYISILKTVSYNSKLEERIITNIFLDHTVYQKCPNFMKKFEKKFAVVGGSTYYSTYLLIITTLSIAIINFMYLIEYTILSKTKLNFK